MAATNAQVDTSSTEHGTWRKELEANLTSVTQLISKSLSPISNTPYMPTNDPDNVKMTSLLTDLRKIGFKDVETLLALFNSEVKGQQDDSKFLLEHLVTLLAKLDDNSKISAQLTSGFVNTLWNALPHPPLTSLGTKYKYREADGSNNNIREPMLGAANTPYARSAKPAILQNIALPDPAAIFDSLMARGDKFEEHPNKISSVLFYFATIIIHDIFRTDHNDFNNSMTSSYLDLAPLYGSTQAEQDTVRTFKDGKLKPDCFSEKRILGFPPGVGVLAIMFNRFHNHVVENLAAINENFRFTKPKDSDPKDAWAKYDNDLFQTGRLITCGLYVNCVLKDYVRTILSLNRTNSKWDLDPRTEEGKTLFNSPAAEGTGNQVSAEFNLIYRWHSAVSERDDKWTQDVYAKMFPGKKPEEVSLGELLGALRAMEAKTPDDPLKRPFAGLTRQADGTFNDDDLVEILESSISDVAGSFGANRVPKILKSVEILGIIQARSWNMASLNEFREFAGLTKHKTFEDINPDPKVAEKLRNLYDHPDFVELYPGLVAEKAKPPMSPGSGLCVNFTTSYAILSDAVSLVRGDRFYTADYTPKSLTNWGYNEVLFDRNVDDGCVFYKLILRAFPNHFKGNSIYAHYPFVVPSENLFILKYLGNADKYTWEKPVRSTPPISITSHAVAKKTLADTVIFKAPSAQPSQVLSTRLTKGLHSPKWQTEVTTFFTRTAAQLLKTYSHAAPGKTAVQQVDIVRDVFNLVNARFAASVFGLPIKTDEYPRGIYTEQELYQVLTLIYVAQSRNDDVGKSFQIEEAAKMLSAQLGDLVALSVEEIAKTGMVADVLKILHAKSAVSEYGTGVIRSLVESGGEIKDIVSELIIPTAASFTALSSQILTQVLDYYLGTGSSYLLTLYNLAHDNTSLSDVGLTQYFLEGARLSAGTTPISLVSGKSSIKMSNDQTIPPNSRVIINTGFPFQDVFQANELKLDRSLSSYLLYDLSPDMDVSILAMVTVFKVIVGLKGLGRVKGSAPGGGWYKGGESQGDLKVVDGMYMTPDQTSYSAVPTGLKVQWEG